MFKTYLVSSVHLEEFKTLEEKMTLALQSPETYASYLDDEENDDQGENKPYQIVNGIALYSIKGGMRASGNWFTKWLGIPTYDDIGSTLAAMYQDEAVSQILISMDTPGGQAAGVADLSDTWQRVNKEKPITVHSPGMLASAGIWLASNSTNIYASEDADVGSIGVILLHISQEGMLKKEGIKVTEIKSAPLKYVGNPAKDLTSAEQDHLQGKVDEHFALFKKQMYLTRPGINEAAFTGEMFLATEGTRLGIIDGVKTYSAIFEQLSASAGSQPNHSYKEDNSMKKIYVTAAMASAAIESGADPKSMEIISDEKYAALPDKDKELTAEADVPPVEPEALSAEVQELMVQTATLTEELASALMQVDQLTAQVADLTAKVEAQATDPLRVIAEERVKTMRTALGLVSIEMSDFSTASLLAEHAALTTQFKKAYTPGGHVKPTAPAEPVVKKATVTSIESARLRATGI